MPRLRFGPRPPPERGLGSLLQRAVRAALAGAAVASAVILVASVATTRPAVEEGGPVVSVLSERAAQTLATIDEHGCWTDDQRSHPVPGHAVVTRPGAHEATYVGRRGTSRALKHVFGEPVPGLTVHAFCP